MQRDVQNLQQLTRNKKKQIYKNEFKIYIILLKIYIMSNITQDQIDTDISNFMINSSKNSAILGLSKDQHFDDAEELLALITKIKNIFDKLRKVAFDDIKTKKITDKEEQLKIIKQTLNNKEFKSARLDLGRFSDNFLTRDRDDNFSLVKKILQIYNLKKNLTYNNIQDIIGHLDIYLTDRIDSIQGEKNEREFELNTWINRHLILLLNNKK